MCLKIQIGDKMNSAAMLVYLSDDIPPHQGSGFKKY